MGRICSGRRHRLAVNLFKCKFSSAPLCCSLHFIGFVMFRKGLWNSTRVGRDITGLNPCPLERNKLTVGNESFQTSLEVWRKQNLKVRRGTW